MAADIANHPVTNAGVHALPWLDMADYRPEAKVYWWVTTSLGAAIFAIALLQVAALDRVAILQVLVGVAIAGITGLFPVRVPGGKTSFAGAEIFIFLLLLLHGPAAAALAAACEAAVASWRTSRRWTSRLGSPAMAALALYGCGTAFFLVTRGAPWAAGWENTALFGGLIVFALAYFAANALLMVSLITLKRGERVDPVALLRDNAWMGLVYAASASIAGLVFVSFDRYGAPVLISAVPIIVMFLSTLHLYFRHAEANEHVRQERLASAELRMAKEVAEAASLAKSQFLANMSHEIRTPMNGVLGMAELLLDTELSDRQKRFAGAIRSSGEALLAIINDILDFSKVEAGKVDLESVDFAPLEVIEEMAEILAPRAQEKGIELIVCADAAVPARVRGDPNRTRQILMNLVGNAIKFTDVGEVVVHCSAAEGEAGSSMLRFAVTDSGIGISREERDRLFQAFVQADDSTTRRYGGTGLGLAIAKQLSELMGGGIGVDSEPGQGSTFWFTVRVAKPERSAKPEPLALDLFGQRVLIVESSPANRGILEQHARAWGMQVVTAGDGGGALAVLRDAAVRGESFALALVDMKLPGMNGLDLAWAIHADRSHAGMPVVLLTTLGKEAEVAAASDAGVAECLSKPIRKDPLRKAMVRAIQGVQASAPAPAAPVANRRFSGRVLLVEDNPVNQAVAVGMLETLGLSVDIACDGLEALDRAAAGGYDLALMDCHLPGLDGLAATAEIRRRENGIDCHLPIIALTADSLDGDRGQCIASGMDDYLSKPFSRDELAKMLARWMPSGKVSGGEAQATGNVVGIGPVKRAVA